MKRKSGPLIMRHLKDPLTSGSRTPLSLMKGSVSGFVPSDRDRTLQETLLLLGDTSSVDVGSSAVISVRLALGSHPGIFKTCDWSIRL